MLRFSHQHHSSRDEAAHERGATLVETAVVAPLLILLLIGIVDLGWVFNDTISLRQGAREGARSAVVSTIGTDSSCPSTGFTGAEGSDTDKLFCLVKDRVGLDQADTRVKLDFEGSNFTAQDSLAVCVMYPIGSLSGLLDTFLSGAFKTEVQMRVELTGANLVEAQESPLPGEDWSWCQAEVTS